MEKPEKHRPSTYQKKSERMNLYEWRDMEKGEHEEIINN